MGIDELGLLLDGGLQQIDGGAWITRLESGDGSEIQHLGIVGVLVEQGLAQLVCVPRVSALE